MGIIRWWLLILINLIMFGLFEGLGLAGTIVGSYHDLAFVDDVHLQSTWGIVMYDHYDQVCVYCHTPHNANSNVQLLWNRQLPDPGSYSLYTSPTLKATPQAPSPVSLLCLSCHDGTIALDKVLNVPGGAALGSRHGSMTLTFSNVYDCIACHYPGEFLYNGIDLSATFFGTDLSDDHPVSIEYSVNDPSLVPRPVNGIFPNGIKLIDNQVECVSCHSVHDPDNRPFLRIADSGSALCYTCHIK